MKKTINSSCFGGIINPDKFTRNSITFETTNAIVKAESIRLLGTININGEEIINPFIEDIPGALVTYHMNRTTDGITDIATAYFPFGIPEELEMAISNYVIQEFEITLA